MKNKYKDQISKNKDEMNNYKREISKYNVSNDTKEKIDAKINKKTVPRARLAYSVIAIILMGIISVGIVYAEDIKEFITSWGKTKVTFYGNEGEKKEVELSRVKTVKTKLDDFIFDDEVYSKLDSSPDDYTMSVEGVTLFKNKKLQEINEELGVHILGLEQLNYEYQYTEITKERKIGTIVVKSDSYVIQCGTGAGSKKCTPLARDYKGLYMTATLKTVNTNYQHDDEWSYDPSSVIETKEIKKIGDIEVEGFSNNIPIIDGDKKIGFCIDMYFNYENIRYNIYATNLSHEEIINILEESLK